MYIPALLASLHHLAAFTVVATLAIEVAQSKSPLSVLQARRLQRIDLLFGIAAAVLLIVGLIRVQWFEKGPAYYWRNAYFLIKFGAFIAAALISIYPTITFLSWNRALKAGHAPEVSEIRANQVRLCLMLELTAILIIIPCAALMARGFGFLG
jgi:putative membrane protein